MAAVDPIEGLLALGVITREQLQQAQSVDPDIATTSVGRLVAVGAPAAELLQAMASLAGLPLATPAMLEAAQPVSGLAPALARALRDVPAAPLGRQPDGTLDVVVAEPQAVQRLAALGIAKCRAFLALEFHVRDAADRVLGDDDAFVAAMPADVRTDHLPADDVPADGGVDAAFAFASPLAPPAPAPRPPPKPPTPRPQRGPEPGSEPPSIVLMPFNPNPAPTAPPAPPPSAGMIGEVAAPFERAKVVRETYAPGVRPTSEAPGGQPPGDPFAFMDAMKSPPASSPSQPAPKPSGIDVDRPDRPDRPNRAGAPALQLARQPEKTRAPALVEPKKSRTSLIAGVVVIAAVAAGGVMFGPTIAAKLNPPPPPPPDPAVALAADQEKELAAATQFAKNESPVDAIIHCENVEKLSRTTAAAHKCAILAAEQHVKVKDPDPLDDLKSMIAATPDSDPDKAELNAALDRLDPRPKSVVDTKTADAGVAPAVPKKQDLDLDHDAAGSGARPKPAPDEQQ